MAMVRASAVDDTERTVALRSALFLAPLRDNPLDNVSFHRVGAESLLRQKYLILGQMYVHTHPASPKARQTW